ncbi:CPBP family intramembrane glutamic endopeptidase [Acidaminobacterium chupaoyuni]
MEKVRQFRNAAGYIFLFLLIQTACDYAFTAIAGARYTAVHPAGDVEKYLKSFIAQYTTVILAVSQLLTLAVVFLIARFRHLSFCGLVECGGAVPTSVLGNAVLAGLLGNLFTSLFLDLLPFSKKMMESYADASGALDTSMIAANLISVVLLAPIVEEVIFRGLAFSRLSRVMAPGLAVVIQGVVFGVIHGTVIWAIYAATMGVLLGLVRWKTNSLKASIAMHMAFNAASLVVPIITYFVAAHSMLYYAATAVAFAGFAGSLRGVMSFRPAQERF